VRKVDFDLGARVRLSELGRKNTKCPDKQGIVVGISRTGTAYRVRWGDQKTADYVHWSFLQASEELVTPAWTSRPAARAECPVATPPLTHE
jgi:hypothetical protein